MAARGHRASVLKEGRVPGSTPEQCAQVMFMMPVYACKNLLPISHCMRFFTTIKNNLTIPVANTQKVDKKPLTKLCVGSKAPHMS